MNKNFKKFFAVVMVIAILATQFAIPCAAATTYYCSECGESGVKGTLRYEIAPTCEDGYQIYDCNAKNCDGTITLRVAATGKHTSDDKTVEAVAATCTQDGTVAYETCTVCACYLDPTSGNKLDSIVDPKTGHNYSSVTTDPNCTADGYTTYTCSNCNDSYVDNETDCLGHDFSVYNEGKMATCKQEGWSEYYTCSRCGAEDPERSKEIEPVQDHGLELVDHKDADCVTDGYNKFKCKEPTCPYYNGITETLNKLGHDRVFHKAVEATCTEIGYAAYYTCKRCDYTTYNPSQEIAALGHTEVAAGYIAPTCTEPGCTNAIICDRCQFIHHPGEIIEPTGHNLAAVAGRKATCAVAGRIAYNQCQTCKKNFATDVTNDDITAKPLTNVILPKLGHAYEEMEIAPTCTESGYTVYSCTRDNCNHTYSKSIDPTGHAFEKIAQVDPTCLNTGTMEHNKCTACSKLFDSNADQKDITAVPVDAATLVIAALGHKDKIVDRVTPTYDAAGNEAGIKCERCDTPLVDAARLDELDETVKFRYEISGVNGSETAVNSGFVTLKIYFDVLADADDKAEYNSDVLANIFGVDLSLNYNKDAFQLTYVEVAPEVFAKAEFTPLTKANAAGEVSISQDMVTGSKAFRGENLFATLTFQVNRATGAGVYDFVNTNLNVVHPENETIDTTASATSASIEVKKLGDANADTIFTSHDTLEVSKYIQGADLSTGYVAPYDMDKDGDIDFIDLDLIRKANVGNDEYLDIIVDPNAVVTPEV